MTESLKLTNGTIALEAPLDRGPRITHFGTAGGRNVFASTPQLFTDTALGRWHPIGGHRLWVAPERMPGSYAPDDHEVKVVQRGALGATLHAPVDAAGMEKAIDIDLHPTASRVVVTHRVINRTHWPVRIAPWGITIVDPAGTAALPQPPRRSHAEQFLPERRMVQWAYTDFTDARWHLGRDLITLTPDATRADAQKVGLANAAGWCAVVYHDCVFAKYSAWDPAVEYPDLGCNTEVFTAGAYLEVETLGPLTCVEPGRSATHVETWMLLRAAPAGLEEADLALWLVEAVASHRDELHGSVG